MDDGNSWIGIVLFAASVILFAVMYGFGAAVQAPVSYTHLTLPTNMPV